MYKLPLLDIGYNLTIHFNFTKSFVHKICVQNFNDVV